MTKKRMHWFARMVKSQTFTLGIGILLVLIGVVEICEATIPDFESFLSLHHGLILIGISHIGKAAVHLLEGAEALLVSEAVEEIDELKQQVATIPES